MVEDESIGLGSNCFHKDGMMVKVEENGYTQSLYSFYVQKHGWNSFLH